MDGQKINNEAWIYGLPSEEQLLANESRLWLKKTDNHLHGICELLPKEERKTNGNIRYYINGEKLCEIDGIDYFFDVNEFWQFTIDSIDTPTKLAGQLIMDSVIPSIKLCEQSESIKQVGFEVTINKPSWDKEEECTEETQKTLLKHLSTKMFTKLIANEFKLTQDEQGAFDRYLQFFPIDKDGNKISLSENICKPLKHLLPPNYFWLKEEGFVFRQGDMVVTFNIDSGEFGICYVINGVELDFAWKSPKPKQKPTHFAYVKNEISF